MTALGEIRSIVLPVSDMDSACRYYAETLGFELKFRDGSRWARLDGGCTISLAGVGQTVAGEAGVMVKVRDVVEALAVATVDGAELVEPPTRGAHERRAAFRDPEGHLIYVYSALPSAQ